MSYLVSPFNRFGTLNRELSRFFDNRLPFAGAVLQDEFDEGHWSPSVDITENAENIRVVADVPGVDPASMEINLHNGVLTMRGERSTENEVKEGDFTRRERIHGTFVRQFHLPDSADEETVSAKSVNGVLEIVIPKAKRAKPITVKVEGGEPSAEE